MCVAMVTWIFIERDYLLPSEKNLLMFQLNAAVEIFEMKLLTTTKSGPSLHILCKLVCGMHNMLLQIVKKFHVASFLCFHKILSV